MPRDQIAPHLIKSAADPQNAMQQIAPVPTLSIRVKERPIALYNDTNARRTCVVFQ